MQHNLPFNGSIFKHVQFLYPKKCSLPGADNAVSNLVLKVLQVLGDSYYEVFNVSARADLWYDQISVAKLTDARNPWAGWPLYNWNTWYTLSILQCFTVLQIILEFKYLPLFTWISSILYLKYLILVLINPVDFCIKR